MSKDQPTSASAADSDDIAALVVAIWALVQRLDKITALYLPHPDDPRYKKTY